MMNVVLLSPHFPPNYYLFSVRLKEMGAHVLGLADQPYEALRPELRWAFSDYVQVGDMHDYGQLLRALGKLTWRHGKIDRLDSHNEHWLETEARLRTDFNITGIRAEGIAEIKRKSLMKEKFRRAGVAVARGRVAGSRAEARAVALELGFPLVAKPDVGVGALATFKIAGDADLDRFFASTPPTDYIFEEFIEGRIFSFDGLADRDGNPVFHTAHAYSRGIMETVNEDDHVSYWSLREIPADLEAAGRAVLREFAVRERFFHFEFFRAARDGRIVALEVNMRPPGGLTTDMFNYANDIDIYGEWARLLVHNRFEAAWSRPYHCAYIGRKRGKPYARSHEEVLGALGPLLVHHETIDSVFRAALGDQGYLVRSRRLAEIEEAVRIVQELRPVAGRDPGGNR